MRISTLKAANPQTSILPPRASDAQANESGSFDQLLKGASKKTLDRANARDDEDRPSLKSLKSQKAARKTDTRQVKSKDAKSKPEPDSVEEDSESSEVKKAGKPDDTQNDAATDEIDAAKDEKPVKEADAKSDVSQDATEVNPDAALQAAQLATAQPTEDGAVEEAGDEEAGDEKTSGKSVLSVAAAKLDKTDASDEDETSEQAIAGSQTGVKVAADDNDNDAAKDQHPAAEKPAVLAVKPSRPRETQASDEQANQSDGKTDASKSSPELQSADAGVETVSDDKADTIVTADKAAPRATSDQDLSFANILGAATTPKATESQAQAPQSLSAEVRFAEVNHPSIVSHVRTELLPNGGTMNLRLDPPELGVLQVKLHMRDGVMEASFQTSNDDATKLLSHSLGQLKDVLERAGITIDKLHVQQAPRDEQSNQKSDEHHQREDSSDQQAMHQERQRKELMRRMWKRLSMGDDPLDLVA